MATRKTPVKGSKLLSLLGKQVRVRQTYTDTLSGPFEVLGVDFPMICLGIEGSACWCNLTSIEMIAEYTEVLH